jgi:hypothetical protein
VGFRKNRDARQVFLAGVDFAGQWIDLADGVDLLAPHFEAEAFILIRGIDFDHVAANAKSAPAQIFGALVLNIHQAAQQRLTRSLLALFQCNQHAVISFRRADAVDAGDGGDDDNVAAFEQRARGAHAQLVQLVVDGGFLIDVNVGRGNVGFRLIKIVVADEIFDGVFREETFKFVIELRGQSFVVRQDQSGAIGLLNQLGHGESLAGASDTEKDLVFFARFNGAIELVNRGGLVAARLISAVQLEIHGKGLLELRRPMPKPSLYSQWQIVAFDEKRKGSVRSRQMRRRFRDQQDFGVALGVNVVVHAVGAIGFGDDHIHELGGLFGGTHDETIF